MLIEAITLDQGDRSGDQGDRSGDQGDRSGLGLSGLLRRFGGGPNLASFWSRLCGAVLGRSLRSVSQNGLGVTDRWGGDTH